METDAGRDARVDSGPRDAGAVEPEWIPLEGLPAGCELSMAADPEAVAGPLRFEPCSDMAGCRQLVVDWTTREPPRLTVTQGAHDGERGYFVFTRAAAPYWRWHVIARDDGRVISVIRDPIPSVTTPFACYLGSTMISPPNAAITIATDRGDSVGDSIIGLLSLGEPSSFRVLATLTPSVLGTNNYVAWTVMGEDFVAGQVVLRNDIIRVGFDGSVRWITRPESGSPRMEAAAGDAIFYGTDLPRTGLWAATDDDAAGRPIWAPEGIEIGGIGADGEHLVWAQMSERLDFHNYGRVELWTAPFATDGAALRPRRIVRLPGANVVVNNLYYGEGHVLIAEHIQRVTIYSLESGRIGSLAPPPGTEWRNPYMIYLGPEAVALAPRMMRAGWSESSTLRIIRYDSIPPE